MLATMAGWGFLGLPEPVKIIKMAHVLIALLKEPSYLRAGLIGKFTRGCYYFYLEGVLGHDFLLNLSWVTKADETPRKSGKHRRHLIAASYR
jgi:hypothetical protein